MKKIFLLSIVIIAFSACRKKYNCVCGTTVQYSRGQDFYSSNAKPISEKMTKKQAQSVCTHEAENINQMYVNYWTNNGTSPSNGTTFHTTCRLE